VLMYSNYVINKRPALASHYQSGELKNVNVTQMLAVVGHGLGREKIPPPSSVAVMGHA